MRTGIVLAGGRSSRFGGDKLRVMIADRSLLDRAIAAVSAVTDEVIVVGRTVEAPSRSVRGLPDPERFGGPLVALHGALREARHPWAVVVAGDMPYLVADVLRTMLERLETDPLIDAVVLSPPNGRADAPQMLPLALRVERAAPAADAVLATGGRSLQSLLDHLAWIQLPGSDWLALDPEARTLLDVDTPADLERMRSVTGR